MQSPMSPKQNWSMWWLGVIGVPLVLLVVDKRWDGKFWFEVQDPVPVTLSPERRPPPDDPNGESGRGEIHRQPIQPPDNVMLEPLPGPSSVSPASPVIQKVSGQDLSFLSGDWRRADESCLYPRKFSVIDNTLEVRSSYGELFFGGNIKEVDDRKLIMNDGASVQASGTRLRYVKDQFIEEFIRCPDH
jgi:hypothetical protein